MGGYRGPAEVLALTGARVADAHATYDVITRPRSGLRDWRGVLTRIDPPLPLVPDEYRLRLPSGEEGLILISNVRISSNAPQTARFHGNGPAPGHQG